VSQGRLSSVVEAREKALAEAREVFVKESFYRDADFRAKEDDAAANRAKAEAADLTKVLEDNSKELEDVIAEYHGKLAAAQQDRDTARAAAAALREELKTLKGQHAQELATEKEASSSTILAVQQKKTSFEAFVREMSRQLLGKFPCFLLLMVVEVASPRA
jgi:uncharacterized protein involved in exopolysaccharide biosynthesis